MVRVSGSKLWALTVLVVCGFGAVVALVVLAPANSASSAAAVTAILAMLTTVLSAAYIGEKVVGVRQDVAQVQKTVNGNTARLIEKIPEPDRPPVPELPTPGGV